MCTPTTPTQVIKLISQVIADFANGEISQAASLFDTETVGERGGKKRQHSVTLVTHKRVQTHNLHAHNHTDMHNNTRTHADPRELPGQELLQDRLPHSSQLSISIGVQVGLCAVYVCCQWMGRACSNTRQVLCSVHEAIECCATHHIVICACSYHSECSVEVKEAMYEYGKHLGLAFQVVDDVLDFTQTSEQLGKPQVRVCVCVGELTCAHMCVCICLLVLLGLGTSARSVIRHTFSSTQFIQFTQSQSQGQDLASGNLTAPVIFALRNTEVKDELLEIIQVCFCSDQDEMIHSHMLHFLLLHCCS